MLFSNDRRQLRRYFRAVWHKRETRQPLEPLERIIAAVIGQHPEYHALFTGPEEDALERDYLPERGEANPFLHMGMHIAIQEQLTGNRPMGILSVYQQLCRRCGDCHGAEHRMMEALSETLWEAQRNGTLPNEVWYLQKLNRLVQPD